MQSLHRGRYELVASARGYAEAAGSMAAGGDYLFELSRAESLTVRVIDAKRSTPLEAHVIVRDSADRTIASRPERRPDGAIAFSLQPGRYTVTAMVQGYAQPSVTATAPGTVEIAVAPGGSVLIESERPLQGRAIIRNSAGLAAVPCCDGTDWTLTRTRTLIQQLASGSYTAELLNLEGRPIASVTFVIRPQETARVSVPSSNAFRRNEDGSCGAAFSPG